MPLALSKHKHDKREVLALRHLLCAGNSLPECRQCGVELTRGMLFGYPRLPPALWYSGDGQVAGQAIAAKAWTIGRHSQSTGTASAR